MIFSIVICFLISFVLRRGSLRIPFRPNNESFSMALGQPVLRNYNYKAIDRWKFKYASGEEVDNCAICCEEFLNKTKLVKLPDCNHFFHSDCIKDWLKVKPLCPICKADYNSYFEVSK